MDYQRIYNEFIADRRGKEANLIASGEYKEHHHIVPRSLGGTDDASNMIALTPFDHFMAHYYLAKAFGGNQWGAVHALLTMDYKNIGRAKMCKHIEANPEKFAAIVAEAREEYAKSQTGALNNRANQTVRTWINEGTGEIVVGTWHAVSENPKKDGFTSYLSGRTITSKTGWFSTDRFESLAAIKAERDRIYKERVFKGREAAKKNVGANNTKARAVYCVELDQTFDTASAAARDLGLSYSAKFKIGEAARGARRTAGGYRWAFPDDHQSMERAKSIDTSKRFTFRSGKRVKNLTTGEVFGSSASAGKALCIKSHCNIGSACRGRQKTAGGFRWAYA